ncbi:MAG TPA: hypothetical protein VFL62_23890 [Bradyrhizobium sp.]|uniref:hypothetical protein n=1 Tax=Bradyrhizobium sp. TaxID=376 RepID=UPI002D7EE210|nr:hypothetical protein [Bradyrhizobium sp.]HET7889283.1 hypothetical protein [Bradyrhizobium sp.]
MKARTYGILVASIGAIALTVATTETYAASRGAHFSSHRLAGHAFRHHHRGQDGFVWADGGYFYGPTGDAVVDGAPLTGEIRNSNASDDIPWDWAHRYPPLLGPSGRPYVSSCGAETVTVPDGRGGTGQVNITRCY